jgi:hypothetical protein
VLSISLADNDSKLIRKLENIIDSILYLAGAIVVAEPGTVRRLGIGDVMTSAQNA